MQITKRIIEQVDNGHVGQYVLSTDDDRRVGFSTPTPTKITSTEVEYIVEVDLRKIIPTGTIIATVETSPTDADPNYNVVFLHRNPKPRKRKSNAS